MDSPRSALLLEPACNFLERGSFRWDAVPARADDVHKVTANDIGGRKLGPHVFI
jgi:hypothetical protein